MDRVNNTNITTTIDSKEIVDLDNYEPDELELLFEWDVDVKRKFREYCHINNYITFEGLMKEYITLLKWDVHTFKDLKVLKEKMYFHIQFFYTHYKCMRSNATETYLDNMVELLTYYCNVELAYLSKSNRKNINVKSPSCRISRMLTVYLFNKEDQILHVLINIDSYESSPAYRKVINYLYIHFLLYPRGNLDDEAFCRNYILYQKWKKIRKERDWSEMDKNLYQQFKRTPDSIRKSEVLKRILLPVYESLEDLVLHMRGSLKDIITAYFAHIKSKKLIQLENLHINACKSEQCTSMDDNSHVDNEYSVLPTVNPSDNTCVNALVSADVKIQLFEESETELVNMTENATQPVTVNNCVEKTADIVEWAENDVDTGQCRLETSIPSPPPPVSSPEHTSPNRPEETNSTCEKMIENLDIPTDTSPTIAEINETNIDNAPNSPTSNIESSNNPSSVSENKNVVDDINKQKCVETQTDSLHPFLTPPFQETDEEFVRNKSGVYIDLNKFYTMPSQESANESDQSNEGNVKQSTSEKIDDAMISEVLNGEVLKSIVVYSTQMSQDNGFLIENSLSNDVSILDLDERPKSVEQNEQYVPNENVTNEMQTLSVNVCSGEELNHIPNSLDFRDEAYEKTNEDELLDLENSELVNGDIDGVNEYATNITQDYKREKSKTDEEMGEEFVEPVKEVENVNNSLLHVGEEREIRNDVEDQDQCDYSNQYSLSPPPPQPSPLSMSSPPPPQPSPLSMSSPPPPQPSPLSMSSPPPPQPSPLFVSLPPPTEPSPLSMSSLPQPSPSSMSSLSPPQPSPLSMSSPPHPEPSQHSVSPPPPPPLECPSPLLPPPPPPPPKTVRRIAFREEVEEKIFETSDSDWDDSNGSQTLNEEYLNGMSGEDSSRNFLNFRQKFTNNFDLLLATANKSIDKNKTSVTSNIPLKSNGTKGVLKSCCKTKNNQLRPIENNRVMISLPQKSLPLEPSFSSYDEMQLNNVENGLKTDWPLKTKLNGGLNADFPNFFSQKELDNVTENRNTISPTDSRSDSPNEISPPYEPLEAGFLEKERLNNGMAAIASSANIPVKNKTLTNGQTDMQKRNACLTLSSPKVLIERNKLIEDVMKDFLKKEMTRNNISLLLRIDYDKQDTTTERLSSNSEKYPRCTFICSRKHAGKVKLYHDEPIKREDEKLFASPTPPSTDESLALNLSLTNQPDVEFSNSPKFLPERTINDCLILSDYPSRPLPTPTPTPAPTPTPIIPNCCQHEMNDIGGNLPLLRLPAAVPETYDFENHFKNEVFSKVEPESERDDSEGETKLPLKKRKLSVVTGEGDERELNKETEISYPATPMISIAELEALTPKADSRTFKTLAERKEMPPLPPVFYGNDGEQMQPIITDRFSINNHSYNNPTINYHMNNIPVPFINIPCAPIYSMPPILLPFNTSVTPSPTPPPSTHPTIYQQIQAEHVEKQETRKSSRETKRAKQRRHR